jgi:hypothetical protein
MKSWIGLPLCFLGLLSIGFGAPAKTTAKKDAASPVNKKEGVIPASPSRENRAMDFTASKS